MPFPTRSGFRTAILAAALISLAACGSGKDGDKAMVLQGQFVSQPPTNSPVAPESGGILVIPNHGPARVCPREGC